MTLPRTVPLPRGGPIPRRRGIRPRQASPTAQRRSQTRRDTGPTREVRQLVAARSGGSCEIARPGSCQHLATDQHHRRPRGAGGSRRDDTNVPSNLLCACRGCHSWVESNRQTALAFGWLLGQHQRPAASPVQYRGEWARLDDDGGVQR